MTFDPKVNVLYTTIHYYILQQFNSSIFGSFQHKSDQQVLGVKYIVQVFDSVYLYAVFELSEEELLSQSLQIEEKSAQVQFQYFVLYYL